jgi:two-component system CheB/CheR fusion protein
VVGLAASAGGLTALKQFFGTIQPDTGLAFVVVTHQHPTQVSLLAQLLGRKTTMPVVEASTRMRLEPNHVYTCAPGTELTVKEGELIPAPAGSREPPHLPLDRFFRSLAEAQREQAVAIVLSGTGADGSQGIKSIKARLGMVMAQDEATAEYRAMPQNAINTQLVDFVLPAEEMPAALLKYVATLPHLSAEGDAAAPERLSRVLSLIRQRTGHDFSQYKVNTIRRRVARRINVHHLDGLEAYVSFLRTHPLEVDTLFKELLIGVTSFFRDPEAFAALGRELRILLDQRPEGHVVRVWVPGCSTGEEAYSIAILLREVMDEMGRSFDVQIFATDLDIDGINIARSGCYPIGIANDLSPSRLERFYSYSATDETYRVRADIREMLIFAAQNLIGDPPFTKIDLLSCRNLLIYLNGALQQRVLPMFHYALRPAGLLFLGSSESTGGSSELFTAADKKWKVFRRNQVAQSAYTADFTSTVSSNDPTADKLSKMRPKDSNVARLAEHLLLAELVPPTVLVHENGDTLHIHGRTGRFLEPAEGPQGANNLFNMAREGLQGPLTSGLREAASSTEEVVKRGVHVKTNGSVTAVDVRIRQLRHPPELRGLFRITFDAPAPAVEASVDPKAGPPSRVHDLERELQYTKESHQGTTEELETANEELKSTIEELQSANEELQSANEELETSQEEMQSRNEELQTVNAELQRNGEELSRANTDMKNLLNSTTIATVFLDDRLRIKRFTEQATNVIRLIPSDVGRPVGDLVSRLRYNRLVEDARQVLDTLVFKEAEVQGEEGDWYLMRMLPYRTTDNVIDGLVLTFVNITTVRALQSDQRQLFKALTGSPTTIFGQDAELRITWAFGGAFGRSPSELSGRSDVDLFGAEAAAPLLELKRRVLKTGLPARQRFQLPVNGASAHFDVFIEPLRGAEGAAQGVCCVVTNLAEP